jgi:hypothetical protein
MGEVGESRSLEPFESFVRFFLRKPRVGMGAAEEAGMRRACPGAGFWLYLEGRRGQSQQQQQQQQRRRWRRQRQQLQ